MLEHELEIARPVREVYGAFSNPENMPLWLTGFQRLEPISGVPGAVGSVSRHVYVEGGRTVELIETVTAHEPERRFAVRIESQGVTCSLEIEFVDRGDCTLLRARSDFRSASILMRMMLPLVQSGIHKRQAGDFERFKSLIEAGVLPPV